MKSRSKTLPALRSTERRRTLSRLAGLGCLLTAGSLAAQGGGMTPVSGTPPAPPLVLPDFDGKSVDLAASRGRLVLVNFWATWCPPCRREFPSLGRVQKLFNPGEFTVLAVNVGEDEETVFSFTGATDVKILLDRDSAAMRRWPVKGLPTTFIVDRQGRLALRAVGGRDFDDPAIVAQMRALLKNA